MPTSAGQLDSRKGKATLWFGLLAGPAAWFLHLVASYAVVTYTCGTDLTGLLHLITVGALALTGVGLWTAWRCWRQVVGRGPAGERTSARSRLMAVGGLANGVLFALVILAAEIANWFFDPCGYA